jgi:signal transduction histidine kinase/DNA-binding response OmpR family regulator
MPRILVVDDDPHVARTLVDLLALHEYRAERAESGEQALELLVREPFDLVLLDVRLPGMNGFATCLRIRERIGPSLPVIILTALGDPASLREGYDAGADDFLTKPVDTPAMLYKVRAFLRMKSLHDETVRNREEAQARARDLALLHEIGRDWSLIAEPEEFNRTVTERLAGLIGAPICLIAQYDAATRTLAAALPVYGLPDEVARRVRYEVKPEHRGMWNFRTGRSYLSNHARTDTRLIREMVELMGADSVVLVPMVSEGAVLGLLVALNKPGGFTEADVQLMTIFAGPAATFIRSRQIFDRQGRHAHRMERLSALMGEMATSLGRTSLLNLAVSRIQADLGYEAVSFHVLDDAGGARLEAEAGSREPAGAPDPEMLRWAQRGTTPLPSGPAELAVPVRAGDQALGVLHVRRGAGGTVPEEESNLLSTLAGHLALALQKAESVAKTERLAAQMATLYDLGLQTTALQDLRPLFAKATEEVGRLTKADHTSVLRLDPAADVLRFFAAWTRDPALESYGRVEFRLGEGVAGQVARDRVPALVNDPDDRPQFVALGNPIARLICVPLVHHERDGTPNLFGVLNASRRPGTPPFTSEDLEYLTRFASQLSIAVANSMAFAAERERSEQLALVNTLIREIAGNLSREAIMKTSVRRIHEAFRYPVVCIGVPEPAGDRHVIVAAASREPRAQEGGAEPLRGGVSGRAILEKRTVLVPDVGEDPDYLPLFPSTRSMVSIPIFSGEEVVAVLTVGSDVRRGFDRGQVITLETLADGIGIILRNAELYQALERTNAKLVELDRMKSELVNIVAHDFRSPLAGVLGHAELLEWKPDASREERVDQARAIIRAATHMANLVDKTLKTTRLETGHFPFEFSVVEMGAVLRAVVSRLPDDARHPVAVDTPDDPVPCWADQDRMSEVVENLVSNAVKYSPAGGPVRVELKRDAEFATLTVVDVGMGIEAKDMDRLFRPFSRVRTRRTAEIEGSGLGLYICDRIVKAHGGRLWVESRPGQGSAFSFALPIFGAAAQTRAPVVLVAAGDEWTRREVRRVAESHGYATHEVSDGVEAVEAAMRLVPAAVVLDRILPRLGAGEVAERLKENAATEAVPLFALAAQADLGERSHLFAGYVPKPIDSNRLSEALEAISRALRAS